MGLLAYGITTTPITMRPSSSGRMAIMLRLSAIGQKPRLGALAAGYAGRWVAPRTAV